MAWVVLIVSGVLEAVWATALSRFDGLTRPVLAAIFMIALVLSMAGLAIAMRHIQIGTAYAVWVGIGATLTATIAMAWGGEPISLVRLLLLGGIVGCVIGLKLITP